jgi:hypothetical protein
MGYADFEKYLMYCIDYLEFFGLPLSEAFSIVEDASHSRYIPDDYTNIAERVYDACLERTDSYETEMNCLYLPTYMRLTDFKYNDFAEF